jgi:hypothetical protein
MKTLIDIKIRQSQIHQEHLTISVASYSIYLLYDMDFNIYILKVNNGGFKKTLMK